MNTFRNFEYYFWNFKKADLNIIISVWPWNFKYLPTELRRKWHAIVDILINTIQNQGIQVV